MVGTLIFALLAGVAIAAAIGMLTSENAVHAALFLVINFVCVALFYLGLNAPFLAVVQVTVYAGAIMVLFLFVIMLLGAEGVPMTSGPRFHPVFAALLVILLFVTMALILFSPGASTALGIPEPLGEAGTALEGFGSPAAIADILFTSYLLPFYAMGLLLLVAMIGAVVLTRDGIPKKRRKRWERMLETGDFINKPDDKQEV